MSARTHGYPPRQKENLVEELRSALNAALGDAETFYAAFRSVSLDWLGYEDEAAPTIIDGSGDRGFDAYKITGSEIDIFQFKSQDFSRRGSILVAADPDCLKDLSRIVSFLDVDDYSSQHKNRKVRTFVSLLQTVVDGLKDAPDAIILVRINLVCLYDGMTSQARSEFSAFCKQNTVCRVHGREALLEINFIDIDQLLELRWRETNTRWTDASGSSSDWINIQYDNSNSRGFIGDRSSLVFYGRARDLIDAYRRFGYQLFEANVRCEIRKSAVNAAIRAQIATDKGIDEFQILNNGLTIICNNKKRPHDGSVAVHQPQIVNGLQTITTLFEAYEKLGKERQNYFDKNCFVLMRIYDKQAISDIPKLVKATNNQNKMEPRNLHSNDPDQISFEKSFASLGWFYERKDFAWNAFDKSENSWSTLRGFTGRSFKVNAGGKGRPIVRKVDNEDIGQNWLAFIGYVSEAAHKRRDIFENERWYSRVFQTRMTKPAYDYGYEFSSSKTEEELVTSAPSADALLLSHLTYRLAKELIVSPLQLKESIIVQRGWHDLSDEDVDKKLRELPEFITGLALSAGTFLFTEMCGLIFLRAFGAELYNGKAKRLLEATDMLPVFTSVQFSHIREKTEKKKYESKDLFSQLWLLFGWIVLTELSENDTWKGAFLTESSKPRIMYRENTRRKILDRVLTLDEKAQTRALNYDFSEHFDRFGIIKHIKRVTS
jgi:hypothetical protein